VADDVWSARRAAVSLADALGILRDDVDVHSASLSVAGRPFEPLFCLADGPEGAFCGRRAMHDGWHAEPGCGGLRWGDGVPTTARDVAWTLSAARDAATGYPRLNDFADVAFVNDPNDSTVVIRFAHSQDAIPDVLTDLAILPARLLDSIPRTELRRAAWNEHPVGNGPFRFVAHEPGRRWVFAANPDFPAALGGPPALERFLVVVVDEPTTKLAALTAEEGCVGETLGALLAEEQAARATDPTARSLLRAIAKTRSP